MVNRVLVNSLEGKIFCTWSTICISHVVIKGVFVESTNNPSPVVLSTRGLSKTYSDGTQAVTNLNLDIHAGNVTTLLGHNGAAKTTTM